MTGEIVKPDAETLAEALEEWHDPEGHPLSNVDGMVSILKAARWALGVLEGEATHTNYNTGEPCFCDVRFNHQPGPCLDAEPPVSGVSPENGTG